MRKYLLDFKICNNIMLESKSKVGWEFEKEPTGVKKSMLEQTDFKKQ